MAKLYSPVAEGFALRSMCSPDQNVAGLMMASVDESYFRDSRAKIAYESIRDHYESHGRPPRFRFLSENIAIPEKVRAYLRDIQSLARSTQEVREIADRLSQYRKTRILYDLTKKIHTSLEETSIDVETLISEAETGLASARLNKDLESRMFNIGLNDSADAVVEALQNRKAEDFFIPTGLKAWDDVNRGIPRGSLLTIGGSSGAGKSHSIVSLAEYQASLGYKICVVLLEMTESEGISRFLANISGIDSLRINTNDLTTEENEYLTRKYRRWKKKCRASGGYLSWYVPDSDVSIEEVLAIEATKKPDVIYIDYLGLLKGADGDDQWRKLGQIARYSKVFAGAHKNVVALAAQVDETGRLRYSQAVKEHSSVAWSFVATKTSREAGILDFNTFKSRNLVALDFTVRIEYELSRLRSLTREEAAKLIDPESSSVAASKKDSSPRPKKDRGRDDADHYKFKKARPTHEDVSDAIYKRSRKALPDDSESTEEA